MRYYIGMHIGLYKHIWGDDTPATEQADPAYKGLDLLGGEEILSHLLDGQARAVEAVRQAIPSINTAAEAIAEKLCDVRSRIIHAGAGSSGLLAMQDAMELNPTFGWPLDRQVFLMAGGDEARLKPIGVAEDNIEAGIKAASDNDISAHDVVIVVAASGTTPFSVGLLQAAQKTGALTIAIANNPNTPMLEIAEHKIYLESGPEVVAGSTRMGAGTAQKATLGMLSTLVMTKMGHVVDGFMINMVADNEKLVERAARIVASIAEVNLDKAHSALIDTKGFIKPAILVASGLTKGAADKALAAADGNLRHALDELSNC